MQITEPTSSMVSNCAIRMKLTEIREELSESFPCINRLAVALYIKERDILQTYVYSEDISSNMHNYEAIFPVCTSLVKLAKEGISRVVNDMSIFDNSVHQHTRLIREAGYQASFSMPMIVDGQLLGFVFANSRTKNVLHGEVIHRLKLVSKLITAWVSQDIYHVSVLKSTVDSMKIMSDKRDPETGEHLLRMANFSLIIAREIAHQHGLDDVKIAYIYLYAALHDIGKLSIADSILLKAGPLSNEEFKIMKKHATLGADLASQLIELYGLSDIPYISMLTSIIRSHHEKLDGSGYPDGLSGEEIPIEARIVAVADIFDALTSIRPYKKAWTNEQAFLELRRLSVEKLDKDCVQALCNQSEKVCSIQKLFFDKFADKIIV